MKLKGISSFRKNNYNCNGSESFFINIFVSTTAIATTPMVGSDASCSDLSTEDMDTMARQVEHSMFDHRNCGDEVDKVKHRDGSVDGSCGSSDVFSIGLVELLGMKSHGYKQEMDQEEIYVDQEAVDFGACKLDTSEELDAKYEGEVYVSHIVSINAKTEILKPLSIYDDQCHNSVGGITYAFDGMKSMT
ncbi:hypothetical protein GUJ93_ZPchr0005g16347 [Zizania palustris]|uniref:Uncharacterized protein n=1 Tax=Zizania palustris TaxID=103762 RepID=A0A8J5S4R5_ZIZPA|nr:hypothetical protein GUJ93_ZPchr0005g16347 [Zizania palustris]